MDEKNKLRKSSYDNITVGESSVTYAAALLAVTGPRPVELRLWLAGILERFNLFDTCIIDKRQRAMMDPNLLASGRGIRLAWKGGRRYGLVVVS